jgi:outer membrane receptor for ferrienterochelin and colicins
MIRLIHTTLTILFVLLHYAELFGHGSPQIMRAKTDANFVGHVTSEGKHVPFVTISVKGTNIGTVTDETGHYRLIHMPVGEHTLVATFMGYKPIEIPVLAEEKVTREVNFYLEYDALGLDEIVVTGDRNERKRSESPVVVNSLSAKLFNNTHSVSFGDALNFAPGLRLENNCQNCGFTQVRMNGMEGTYSQVLINSRPIFSGLAGVYGLELIPVNMIERVEVVRGGGSAIYGSNAIAGTINVILKDPLVNSYEVALNSGVTGVGMSNTGGLAPDNHISFNSSMVTSDQRTGLSVFGFHRARSPFDANGDDFSEITLIDNTTIGSRFFHRFGMRSKLSVDFYNIKEERRGGNDFDKLPHLADVSESAIHNISAGAVNFSRFFKSTDMLTAYASGQLIDRDTYYGAEQSLSDYGNTDNFTFNTGLQYKALVGKSIFTTGTELTGETMLDKKLGFLDFESSLKDESGDLVFADNTIIANQSIYTFGLFAQYDLTLGKMLLSMGGRFDSYRVEDKEKNFEPKTGNIFSPRLNILYNVTPGFQARLGYSQGYRAPQIFDEDLHIETSGARQVIHSNADDLVAETSRSYMASMDYNRLLGNTALGVLVEGFYTTLLNPFVLEFGEPDENGVVEYVRENSDGNATVKGINTEVNIIPGRNLTFALGLTLQQSEYEVAHEFDQTRFFRSPNAYGFVATDWTVNKHWAIALTGNYTGKMLMPYFGTKLENPDEGELRESNPFLDMGARVSYNTRLNNSGVQLFAGVKNMLNSYQKDFDTGMDRDPGYLYGPMMPRTIYFGVRVGNLLR